MSYCRFGEGDVYVFTSRDGIECCFCSLQEREWVDDPAYKIFGGYMKNVGETIPNVFRSNQEMIDHLQLHIARGERVPKSALERLADPEDEKENQKIWEKYKLE